VNSTVYSEKWPDRRIHSCELWIQMFIRQNLVMKLKTTSTANTQLWVVNSDVYSAKWPDRRIHSCELWIQMFIRQNLWLWKSPFYSSFYSTCILYRSVVYIYRSVWAQMAADANWTIYLKDDNDMCLCGVTHFSLTCRHLQAVWIRMRCMGARRLIRNQAVWHTTNTSMLPKLQVCKRIGKVLKKEADKSLRMRKVS
jgi:hypothetical protein